MNITTIIRTLERHEFVLTEQQRKEEFYTPLSPRQLLVFEHRDAVDTIHVTHDGTHYNVASVGDSREARAAIKDLRMHTNGGTKP